MSIDEGQLNSKNLPQNNAVRNEKNLITDSAKAANVYKYMLVPLLPIQYFHNSTLNLKGRVHWI